ncbi:MAG: ABC transporter ATP-binding protein [Planctomycetota bacterium]|jgi:lipoprotein-releasing system ATP-binding protein
MSKPILEARGIRKIYTLGGQRLEILQSVDFAINQGEMKGIVGASGAGKSTLLHILGLLDRPDSGEVDFDGERINYGARHRNARLRSRRMGFVFQFYHLLPELNALENVLLNPMMDNGIISWFSRKKQARKQAADLLASLGLGERLKHRPPQLSGGERQRVAIARALLSQPSLLFCDEPTGNLDEYTSETIVELLFRINQERKQAMVVVTHNESLADRLPKLHRLSEGRLHVVENAKS